MGKGGRNSGRENHDGWGKEGGTVGGEIMMGGERRENSGRGESLIKEYGLWDITNYSISPLSHVHCLSLIRSKVLN